ncbi:SprB repeat-containing protein [Hymenobacter canadensis]|uniref:SprB repeat-containing protein n=1 Tax=Hymenobacter canadensis TaxID=2999067 RepID=A0ABY7LRE3_9BACT|nr:SprB repeat-containing protein [Hymenobacter canadensis]WBA42988.1 SprB repeat-containing protein [Hymenobacter canadensis]
MAGERYAQLILNSITPAPGDELSIWLNGAYQRFVASAAQFPSDPEEYYCQGDYSGAGSNLVRYANAVTLHDAIEARLTALGVPLAYTLAVASDSFTSNGVITITARSYDLQWDFAPTTSPRLNLVYSEQSLPAIRPITLGVEVDPVLRFGQATGAIRLLPTAVGAVSFTYAWADGPTTQNRSNLLAADYTVTVTADTGASLTRVIAVEQNPRLSVVVRKFDDSILLTVSGGVAPYTFAWQDGPTTASRYNLAAGSYECTITDDEGATVTISVELEASRYYFSRNPITLPLDAGDAYRADPSLKPNLTFLCEVFIEPEYLSGEFVRVGAPVEQPADRQGRTVFQVEELLDAYLDYYVPAPDQRRIARADPLFRRFYLQHAEMYGAPAERAGTTTLLQHYVLLGGLSGYEAAQRTFFTSYQPAHRPFFTWQPRELLVAPDQPEFLLFQVPTATLPLIRQIAVATYQDGSTATVFVDEVEGPRRYELYCLPAGRAQLALPEPAGKHLVSWEVFVVDEDGVAQSERRRYVLDRRLVAQRRYVLYANSLGGLNTAAFLGEAQLDAEVSGEEAERGPVPFPDPLAGDVLVLDRSLRPVVKLASGARENSREWLATAQDLLLSRRVLLLGPGRRWLPGVVKVRTVPVLKEGEWQQTLELDFQLPRERHYTPALPVVPAGQPVPPVQRQDLLLP